MDRDTVILEVHFFEAIKQKKRVFSLENTLFFIKYSLLHLYAFHGIRVFIFLKHVHIHFSKAVGKIQFDQLWI